MASLFPQPTSKLLAILTSPKKSDARSEVLLRSGKIHLAPGIFVMNLGMGQNPGT